MKNTEYSEKKFDSRHFRCMLVVERDNTAPKTPEITMTKLNKKAATIKGLLACGAYERKNRSSTYRTFVLEISGDLGGDITYLVGSRGSLRRTRSTIDMADVISGGRIHAAYAYVGELTNGRGKKLAPGEYRKIVAQIVKYGEAYIVACSEKLAELTAAGAVCN